MKQTILLLIFPILMLASCATVSQTSGTEVKNTEEETNIRKVRTYWDEVWNKGNLQAVADFYHPGAKHGEDFTIEGFQKGVAFQREAFPDFKATITDIFASGDKVITEVVYTGTHTGRKMFRQDPLGKTIKVPGLDIFTFKDGKCVNHQHVADHLDLVLQMGIKLAPVKDTLTVVNEIMKASDEFIQLTKSLHQLNVIDSTRKNYIEEVNKKLATEYEYTDAEGKTYNKKDDLEYFKKPQIILNVTEVADRKVKMVDVNTAIETGKLSFTGTKEGKPFAYNKRYTTTWAFREGRWQIVADHSSRIETEHDKAQIEAAILYTNGEFDRALKKKDREALSRFFADEYIYTLQDSRWNKEQLISFLVSPGDKIVDTKVEDRQFRVLNNSSAVETGKLKTVQIKNGKRTSESHYITVVWVYRDGRWQAVAEHWNKINVK